MKTTLISFHLFFCLLSPAAAQLYWDSNGSSPGAGGATPAGTWGTDAFWSGSLNGDLATDAWIPGSPAVFAAGTDATGTYTITVTDTQSVGGLTFEEGTVTLSGGTIDFTSGGVIQVDAAQGIINSAIAGTAPVSQLGTGTLVLGGNSTFSGLYSLAQGTLSMGAPDVVFPASVTVGAGTTLNLNDFSGSIGSAVGFGGISLGSGTLTVLGMVANSRFDGIISGTGNLVKTGTNILTLGGANTFSGKTAILGGLLSLGVAGVDDLLGTPPDSYVADQLTIDAGVLHFPASSPTQVAANRGIYLGPSGGTITMGSSKSPAIYPDITGPGSLLKSSTGNMSLFGSNSFAGGLTILAGGVRFNSDYAAGTGPVTVNPSAGVGVFLRNLTPPGNATTLTNSITVLAGTGFADLNAALPDAFTISGPISGDGPLQRGQQAGSSGYVILAGDNSGWSGGLTFWRGKLALGNKNALGAGAFTIRPTVNTGTSAAANFATVYAWTPLTGADAVATPVNILITNASAHFSFGGTNALEFSGPIDLGPDITPIITVTNSGGTILSGPIGGGSGVGLTKDGADTLTLSGTSSYSGPTTVDAGTLLVNAPGSLPAGGVTVNVNGTLGGSGTVNGLVTANGGSVAAGSLGILTLASGLDLSAGGTNIWELAALKDNTDGTAGADFGQIALTGGTLTLGGSSTLKIGFTGTASEPDSSNPFWQSPRSWTIISAPGAASNFSAIESAVYPAGTFATSVQAGGIVLTFTPSAATTPVTSFGITTGPGSDLSLNYAGGSGAQFVLLGTNNVAAPVSLWIRLQTNASTPGSFTITPGSDPQQFYRIQVE